MILARRRVRLFTPPPEPEPPPSSVIAAELRRYDGASTTALWSSGIPLQPGALTKAQCDARAVRVLVNGSEVAASVTALRGRHTDGSLRSVLVQIEAACPADGTVPVEVQLGETRTTTDRSYIRPTDAIAHSGRYILPTSATYLCGTLLTFQHLLPASALTGPEALYYNAFLENRFDALVAAPNFGTAYYDTPNGLLAAWCRTGNAKYYREALLQTRDNNLPYFTPSAAAIGPQSQLGIVNPDGRTDGINDSDGIPNEQYTAAMFGLAAAYLLTGYRDYWLVVSHVCQWQHADRSTFSTTMYWNGETPRASMTNLGGVYQLIPAMLIDATLPISGGYGAGRAINFAQQLDWILTILIDTPSWGYSGLLADLIGQRQSREEPGTNGGPTFQWALFEAWLVNCFLYVRADTRIPAALRKIAMTTVQQAQQVGAGAPGGNLSPRPYGYTLLPADPRGLPSSAEPWTLPMHAKGFAFLSRFYPADVVSGASWAEWYERATDPNTVDPSHLNWQWKIFGQCFGAPGQDAPWIMAQSSLSGPATPREPIAYASGPTDTPD